MNYRNVCIVLLLAVCLALAGAVVSQRSNIDPSLHPGLAEAQQHILEAGRKIREAHERDKSDLGGHAEKGHPAPRSGRHGSEIGVGTRTPA